MAAIKSVTECPSDTAMSADSAVGHSVHLRESNRKATRRSDGEGLSQRHWFIARHLKLAPDIMGVPDREFDRLADQTIRIVKP